MKNAKYAYKVSKNNRCNVFMEKTVLQETVFFLCQNEEKNDESAYCLTYFSHERGKNKLILKTFSNT